MTLLLSCGIFADNISFSGRKTPPHIHSKSHHYRFAAYVLAGYPYEDACRILGLRPRSAERWRTALRRTGCLYFGRTVTYEFAARYALDPEFRIACENGVRETPQ